MKKYLFIGAILTICLGFVFATFLPNDRQMLEKAYSKKWAYDQFYKYTPYNISTFDKLGTLCIELPAYLGNANLSHYPMQWYLEIEDKKYDKWNSKIVDKLDALVHVKLLKKSKRVSKDKNIIRYELTRFGWENLDFRHKVSKCFIYGEKKFMGLSDEKIKNYKNELGQKIYVATATEELTKLKPWAKNKRIQDAFNEIKRSLKPNTIHGYFTKHLFGFESVDKKIDYKELEILDKKYTLDMNNPQTHPSKDIIKKLILKTQKESFGGMCLRLPGSSASMNVDEYDKTYPYAVIVYKNKKRASYKRLDKHTMGYLNDLVKSHVLRAKDVKNGDLVGKKYILNDKYIKGLKKDIFGCLDVGYPKDIEIFDYLARKSFIRGAFDIRGRFVERFDKPKWVDEGMLKEWKMLAKVLKKGKAGRISGTIDKNGYMHELSLSYWWAFPNFMDRSYYLTSVID